MDRFFFVPLKYIRPLIHPIKKNIGWFAIRGIQLHLIHPSPQDSILGKKVASLEASLGSVDWKLDLFFRKGHVVGRGIFVVFDTVDIMGVSKNRGIWPPKWMVKIRENPYEQMRWFGGKIPLFLVQHPYTLGCSPSQ